MFQTILRISTRSLLLRSSDSEYLKVHSGRYNYQITKGSSQVAFFVEEDKSEQTFLQDTFKCLTGRLMLNPFPSINASSVFTHSLQPKMASNFSGL